MPSPRPQSPSLTRHCFFFQNLLSLHPTQQHSPWPDAEELLKESLRQSLSALRALRESKAVAKEAIDVELRGEGVLADLRGARETLVSFVIRTYMEEVGGLIGDRDGRNRCWWGR